MTTYQFSAKTVFVDHVKQLKLTPKHNNHMLLKAMGRKGMWVLDNGRIVRIVVDNKEPLDPQI